MVVPVVAWRGARPSGMASASWLCVVGTAWARPAAAEIPQQRQQQQQSRWQAFGTHTHASRLARQSRCCADARLIFQWHSRRPYASRPPDVPPALPPLEDKRLSELLGDKKQQLEAMEKMGGSKSTPDTPVPKPAEAPKPADTATASKPDPASAPKPDTAPAPKPDAASKPAPETPAALPHKFKDDIAQDIAAAAAPNAHLPSAAEERRSTLSTHFSGFMDQLQTRVFIASKRLNDLTGYSAIEQIKAQNTKLEADLAAAQAELAVARREYQAVNERRAGTQRQVTTLLARKDTWAPADLERFTELYRSDHELEAAAARSIVRLNEAEAAESHLSAAVTAGILKRYHEEQVWSDRIRRQSTWGTWGLMAVNVLLFIVLQFFAEPWRRHRLMRGIADAESGLMNDVRTELADVRGVLDRIAAAEEAARSAESAKAAEAQAAEAAAEAARAESAESAKPSPRPKSQSTLFTTPFPVAFSLPAWPSFSWHDAKLAAEHAVDPDRWKAWLADACSDRPVSLHMRDVSLIAVESAAAGAGLATGIALLVWRLS